MYNNFTKRIIVLLLFCSTTISLFSQTYNDGPLRLRVWAYKAWSSANCGEIGNKEYIINDVRARVDNSGAFVQSIAGLSLSWSGGASRYQNLPNGSDRVPSGMGSGANGYNLLDITYSGTKVPDRFQVYLGNGYEEDCPFSPCGGDYFVKDECCCIFGLCAASDDYFANGPGWRDVFYRGGVEGQVNYTQPILIDAGGEHKYTVVFAYQWDMLEEKPKCASPVYKDGPITVTADVVGFFADMNWDGTGVCGISIGGAEDLRAKVMAVDGVASFTAFPTSANSTMKFGQDVPQWNTGGLTSSYTNGFGTTSSFPVRIFNTTYPNTSTNFSSFKIAYDVWEEDGWYLSALGLGVGCGTDGQYEGNGGGPGWYCVNSDDAHYTSIGGSPFTYSTVPAVNIKTIDWRLSPPNTDNYMDIPINLSNSGYQSWIMRIKYRWTISPPTLTLTSSNDVVGCTSAAGTPMTTTSTNATYYKWQVSPETWPAASGASATIWTDIAGQFCSTYTPPRTAGTRLYRCIAYNRGGNGSDVSVANNTSPKYDSAVVYARYSYFPYAPPIISAYCGNTVTASTAIPFSILVVPAINAVANGTTVTWSVLPSPGVTISAPNGTSTNITFTNVGTYTVTLTQARTGCANATSTCTIQVGASTCDYIYVSSSGVDGGGCGDAANPCRTLSGATGAIAKVVGTRNKIRMTNGTFTETLPVIISNGLEIDGGYTVSGSDWTKNSNSTTNITCSGTEIINATTHHVMGFKAVGRTGWTLKDLNITTVAASGNTTSANGGNGKSNYAIYISGGSGYNIVRCKITSGAATNGLGTAASYAGSAGSTGTVGSTGNAGGSSCGGDGGGSGASGGSGGTGGANNAYVTGSAANGSAGAKGGNGTDDNGNGCWPSPCAGAGGGMTGTCSGGGGAGGASDSGNNNSPYGGTGASCTTAGSAGGNGTSGTAAHSGGWFVPGTGTNGASGGGGGGGAGGGGAANDEGGCDAGGGGGSGGSGGGGGGGAGAGATGGGGSFGIYLWGSGAGTIYNSTINTGVAGTGGIGGTGAAGGSGGVLSPYGDGVGGGCWLCASDDANRGGRGGAGSNGGKGGNGGAGSAGVRYAIAQQNAGTAPTLSNMAAIAVNSATSGGTYTASPVVTVFYGKSRLCKNSAIPITKTTSTWTLGTNWNFVNNVDDATTNYTTSSSPAEIYYNGTVANTQDLVTAALAFPNYLNVVSDDRQLIDITSTVEEKYCYGDAINLTASVWGIIASGDYRWRLYAGTTATGAPIWTNTTASPTLTLTNGASGINATTPGYYTLKYDQKEQCCGWSLPVYRTFYVYPALVAPTTWNSNPASGNYCTSSGSAGTLNVFVPTYTPATGATLMYRYSSDNGVTWSAWSALGGGTSIPKTIGTIKVECAMIYTGANAPAPTSCDTVRGTTDITWTIDDTIPAYAVLDELPICVTSVGGLNAIITSSVPASGTGQWTLISSSPSAPTATPSLPSSANSISLSNMPTPGTATYRWTVTNGLCTKQTDVVVTGPTLYPNNISADTLGCYTCSIVDGVTYTYYDFRKDIIMKIQDLTGGSYSTSALSTTEVCNRIVTPNSTYSPKVLTNFYGDYMPYLKRYWAIAPVGINLPAKITLYFTSGELANLILEAAGTPYAFTSISDLSISKFPFGGNGVFTGPDNILNRNNVPDGEMIVTGGYSGSHPLWTRPVFSAYGSDYKAEFIIDEFSTFYIHPTRFPYEVLPVELVSFTGWNEGAQNKLQWITASEVNTQKFEVEKSVSNSVWSYIGEKPAAGNSTQPLTYDFIDNNPVIGNNYYRLKMIDLDGSFTYSNIINIHVNDALITDFVNVYPNPTSGQLTVEIQSTSNYDIKLQVYDVIGKKVFDKSNLLYKGLNKLQLDFTILAKGTYLLQFSDVNGKLRTTKFIKD